VTARPVIYGRPAPPDFAERAAEMPAWALKVHYHTGINQIRRWYEETGAVRLVEPARAVPDDFADRAAALHASGLMRHYAVSNSIIRRWLAESGLTPAKAPRQVSPKRVPIAEDFAEVAPTLTKRQLSDHYGVSETVIIRWAKESGVRPKRAPKGRLPGSIIASVPQVDASLAARAAQHLRRRHIVYHCAVLPAHERRGLPNKGRDHWYVNGRGALPAADMIALAEQKGFQA
jgi:hypothetical protein